jgi:hypothetical protein
VHICCGYCRQSPEEPPHPAGGIRYGLLGS